jgi:hypothetical protein
MTKRMYLFWALVISWVAILITSHIVINPINTSRLMLWFVGTYILHYLLGRLMTGAGSLGNARIDSNTPLVIRAFVDSFAICFNAYCIWKLLIN